MILISDLKMIGCDYDSESSCDSIHVRSQPTDYEVCPEDIEFKLKIRVMGKSVKPVYTLKKGVSLPYTPSISVPSFSGIFKLQLINSNLILAIVQI